MTYVVPIDGFRAHETTPVIGSEPVLKTWAMTTGEAGMRSQAHGLARAVGGVVEELVIGLRKPWRFFPGTMTPLPWLGLVSDKDIPKPPWPDLLVSCGRRSTAISAAVRRASGGRTLTVHIGHPRTRVGAFDLVFPMDHDGLSGPNVVPLRTSLHDVTPSKLAQAMTIRPDALGGLPRPLLGVIVGGSIRKRPFTQNDARALLARLNEFQARTGGGIALTFSRRTPSSVQALITAALGASADAAVWDGEGASPYLGILARADRLLLTSDSASMISEALATLLPVEVFDLGLGGRLGQFLQSLLLAGLVRRFDASEAPALRQRATNSTSHAAWHVKQALSERGCVNWAWADETSSAAVGPCLDLEQSGLVGIR